MNLTVAAALLFGSGLSALVYQTVWQRLFCLVFGASTGASAAVLGIFLGGLGLGGIWLGARAERSERPLTFYGNLEVVVVLCAAATPFLSDIAGQIYFALGGSRSLGSTGATCVRLLLAAVVMGPATIAMGGTLPAMARAVEHESDSQRGRLAMLYAINTLGAVCGALLGTFALFEVLGIRFTLWTACLLNLLVAIIARSVGRGLPPVVVQGPGRSAANEDQAEGTEVSGSIGVSRSGWVSQLRRNVHVLTYCFAGVVGFSFLMLEVIWYRMLAPLLGGTTFTFGLILAVALAGIGLGGYLYTRREPSAPVTLFSLAATLGLEALFAGLPFMLGDRVALFAAYTRSMEAMGFGGLVTSWILLALIVVFPCALVSGYQFPVLFALLGKGQRGVARHIGYTYACNTLGSITGAILAGFVLIPALGAVASWRLVVALLAVSCAVCWVAAFLVAVDRPKATTGAPLVLALAALSVFFVVGPTAVWRHEPIGAGRAKFLTNMDSNKLRRWMVESRARTVWEADGKESSVRLSGDASYAFHVNGKSDGNVWVDRGTQGMLGVLPALLHPNPRRAFVVGLGTGMSAGWLAQLGSIERVNVAELEPVVLRVAQAAQLANQDVLNNPKVSLFMGDAREYMLTSEERYDIIASEPSNPYRAGVASLFTVEFYQAAAQHLNPGGIFAQWVQGYEVDVTTLRTVLRTLRQVFPYVEVWQSQSADFEILASMEPRRYSREALQQRLAEPVVADLMPRVWLVEGVEGLLAHFIADSSFAAEVSEVGNPAINTDDTNILEYAFARRAGSSSIDAVAQMLKHSIQTRRARPAIDGEVDWDRVDELRPRSWLIDGPEAPTFQGGTQDSQLRFQAVGQACAGNVRQVLELWKAQGQAPRDIVEVFTLALGLASAGSAEALPLVEQLRQRGFLSEAFLVQAELGAATRDLEQAFEAIGSSLREQRKTPLSLCNVTSRTFKLLGSLAFVNAEWAKRAALMLLEGPVAVHIAERERVDLLERSAFASGDAELCLRAMGPRLLDPWWEQSFLFRRYQCLLNAGNALAGQAEDDLVEFLMSAPGTFGSAYDQAAASANAAEVQAEPPQANGSSTAPAP